MINQVYSPQDVSINRMLVNALIAKKSVEPYVVKMFPQLNIWNLIAKKYNAPKQKVGNLTYQMERIGNTYVAANIASQSLSNGQLTLTFDDTTYSGFRKGDLVKSLSGVMGYVVFAQAGSIIIDFQASPITGVTAFDAGADFLVGEQVSSRGDVANVNDPNMLKDRLVEEPTAFFNNIQIMREIAAFTGVEGWEQSYLENVGGKTYQIDNQLKAAMLRIAMNFAVRCYDGIASTKNGRYTSDGFEQQIKKGGGYTAGLSGEVTESSLQGFIDGMIENGGLNGNKVTCVGGNRYIGAIQRNVLKGYVTYPGKENTFKIGEGDGIDGYFYKYNGLEVDFIMDPLFLNANAFPRTLSTSIQQYNNTGFWFSTAPAITNNGTVEWLNQKYYGVTDMIIAPSNSILDANGNVRQGGNDGQLQYSESVIYMKTLQLGNPASCGIHSGTN
jgi:hypothetical protein